MNQNLEKNVEKIVAITLSFGLVTMNVGSSQRKIVRPVSGSSLSQVSNMNTVNASGVDVLECSEVDHTQTVQVYDDVHDSSDDTKNSIEKKTVVLNKKNIEIIRAPEIDFNSIINAPKHDTDDTPDDYKKNTDIYVLDPSEEDMRNPKVESGSTKLDSETPENQEKKSDDFPEYPDETNEPEKENTDSKPEIREPLNLGVEPIKKQDHDTTITIDNIPENTEVKDVPNNNSNLQPQVDENDPKTTEDTKPVDEPEKIVQEKNDVVPDKIVVESPPQIVVTPFGTRIVADESKKEEVTPENTEIIDKNNQQNNSLEEQTQKKIENNTDVPETQNTQIVNYPHVYQTLDDIPEEGVNGTPKSAISALVMAGIPLAVVLLSLGAYGIYSYFQ